MGQKFVFHWFNEPVTVLKSILEKNGDTMDSYEKSALIARIKEKENEEASA